MANFYATISQAVAPKVREHQLLKFSSAKARDRYAEAFGASQISAKEAKKLMIADVWHTSREADCVLHVARYIP